jgi:hypothetical protein
MDEVVSRFKPTLYNVFNVSIVMMKKTKLKLLEKQINFSLIKTIVKGMIKKCLFNLVFIKSI